MAETIDKIQVEVEATAKGTSQVFKELTSNLQTLKSALSSIDTSKLSQVNKASNKIKVDTSGMTKAQKDVEDNVNSIKQALAGLKSLKIAALGGDSSSATSFNRRVISIQSSIDVLKEKLSQLGNTSVPTQAFTDLDSKIETTRTKLQDLESKYASMGGKAVDLGDLTQTQSDIETTKTELDSLIAKQQELINTGQAYTDPFAGYRDSIEEVQSTLASASSEVQTAIDNMSNSASSADTSGLANGLGDVASQAKEAASSLWSMAKSGIKSGFSSLKNSLSKIKDTLTNIGKNASSSVSTGFSKILKYAFGIRSMYVLFRRLRSAVKDSFTELQNSGAYYQTTKANIDALKSSLSTLKYQFGAAFEPIFNTVAPALQTLINYLVTVMNTISAFIAKLTGKSTYSKAVASTAAIAANTGSAAGSAAELNKQLQGFDELNNLDLDSGSSGGSGGGGSSDSGSVQYVEESVDSALTSFWDSLSDAITNGEWYKAGTLISNALTEALNSINWDSIFQSASNFGTGLADFLNGLITDDLFSAVGTTIANALKTALIAAFSFGSEFDWTGLGTAIASGINSFVEANPLDLLVSAFNVWANGILTTLISAIDGISWKDIAQHIADAIAKLDVGGISWNLGTLANEIANALYTLVSNKETWTNLGTKIGEGITNLFKSMNQVDDKTGLTGWQALGKSITSTISGLVDAIKTALETVEWDEVGQAIADFIAEIDVSQLLWDLGTLAWEIVKALADAIVSLWENGDAKTKIGMAIIGLIAVAKLTNLASTLTTLISGAVPSTISLSNPIQLSWLGKVALVAGTAALSWEAGKSLSQWIAEKLSGTEGISAEAASDYIKVSQSMTLEMVLEEISSAANETTASGENRLWKAWQDLVNDWYEPVYEEIDSAQDKNKNTNTKKINGIPVNETQYDGQKKTGKTSTRTFKYNIETQINGTKKSASEVNNLAESYKNLNSEASESAEATYTVKTGGQISSVEDLTDWKNKFHNLRQTWSSKDATLTAKEDGLANGNVENWIKQFDEKKKSWTDKTSTLSVKQSGLESFGDENKGYIKQLNQVKSKWEGKSTSFNVDLKGNIGSSTELTNVANAVSTLNSSFQGDKSASYSVSYSGPSGTDLGSYAGGVASINSAFSEANSKTLAYTISASVDMDSVNSAISKISNEISKGLTKEIKMTAKANGGIITANTTFNIPQYAGGTLNAGSVFVAGESGPEVMGHINGRTEILNRSQIASIMNNSFVSAMAQFGNRMLASPETVAYRSSSYQGYTATSTNGDSLYLAEQNQLLREQNQLLTEILEKPTGISSRDVFNATRSEAQSYYNRTGNSAFM